MIIQPNWDEAPADATHCFVGDNRGVRAHWRKQDAHGKWHETDGLTGRWLQASGTLPREERYIVERPATSAPTHPPGATHTRNSDGRFFKAGPNHHARLWSTYNSLPAWVGASITKNTDLDDPSKFTPINLQQPTTDTEQFTMPAEEAKSLALENRPMKVVEVRFQRAEGAKAYHYYAPQDAKQGDFAVVYANDNIVTGRDFPFTVVQITCDEVIDTQRATKAILGTFNEEFAKHVQARIEHMARVKAKLQTKKKQFEESAFFEMLAKSDPEAAALLDELKSFRM